MRLFSDVFIKIFINVHLYNVHISLSHVRPWCHAHFIYVDLVVFSITGPNHSKKSSYIILQKNPDLLSNRTIKFGYKDKWKFLVKLCSNSFLVIFGLLDSWLTQNFFEVLSFNNRILGAVKVVQIHDPINRFAFSDRKITLLTPAVLYGYVNLANSQIFCRDHTLKPDPVQGRFLKNQSDVWYMPSSNSHPEDILCLLCCSWFDVTSCLSKISLQLSWGSLRLYKVSYWFQESWHSNFIIQRVKNKCDNLSSSATNPGWFYSFDG